MSEVEGQRGRGRPPFSWRDGVRRACAEREMGLEEARGVCMDRDAWRGVTDRIVWLIKCGQRHAFDAVRRGIGHLRWDSAGNSGVLSGVLGVTRPHDDRKAEQRPCLFAPLSSSGVPRSAWVVVMSECECEWVFRFLAFYSVATPWKGEAVTFWWYQD